MKHFLKNYFSTLSFIFIIYIFYKINPYFSGQFIRNFTFLDFTLNSLDIFHILILLYIILLIPFYLIEKEKSKARIIYNFLWKKFKDKNYKINDTEKNSILAWIVKMFFAPLMVYSFFNMSFNLIDKLYYWYKDFYIFNDNFLLYFNAYIFFSFFYLWMFIDLVFFTSWYLLEASFLKNKIKSVEPTVFWWIIALICYPPFNNSTTSIINSYSETLANFWNIYIHITLNTLILILFMIYAWSSFSLWLKASNLTNRWIVKKWPYKYVRHPAYITKNLARFIWALPAIIISINDLDLKTFILIIFSTISWMTIYYLRAITEEKHLEKDIDYIKYQKKVKYKFIPKIF